MKPGPRNLITDVAGLRVGNAQDDVVKTGSTVLIGDKPFVAGAHVMGGAPGTRETDLLAPDKVVQEIDAVVLSGGSAFGLDAASGVADALRLAGRGFGLKEHLVPIVPAAIIFDLPNGGDKNWTENPYKALGRAALANASTSFDIGTAGAGTGAITATLKGGLGSASLVLDNGITVGALAAVNAVGNVVGPEGQFWAAHWEFGDEFGGLGPVRGFDPGVLPRTKVGPNAATAIAIVATDAQMTSGEATRMAVAAHDGIARGIHPSHTPYDGDIVFAIATGDKPLADPFYDPLLLGHAAATCLARAVARGVYSARPAPGDVLPTWTERFGSD